MVPNIKSMLGALAVLAFAVGLPSASYAVSCTVNISQTDPDGSVNSSSQCAAGDSVNDEAGGGATGSAELAAALGGTWSRLDNDQNASDTDNGFYFTGTTSGQFFIDTNVVTSPQLVLVLKDGEFTNPNPPPTNVGWEWFLLDGTSSIACPVGYEICGTWSMYGVDGKQRTVSHVGLYGGTDETDGASPTDVTDPTDGASPTDTVPEPSTLLLFGAGLIAMARFAKKLKK